MVWNDKKLSVILDHVNGNSLDNRPENLRYVCPNCDAQLPTRGGANAGRIVETSDTEYTVLEKSGKHKFYIFPTGIGLRLGGGEADVQSKSSDEGDT